jgi:hypothetical protein
MLPLASRPLREKNAIESAAFAIVLTELLDQECVAAMSAAAHSFAQDLPGTAATSSVFLQPGPGVTINIEGMSPQGGVNRFLARPDGVRSWQVQAEGATIVVMCRDWSRFSEVWSRARRYLLGLVGALPRDIQVAEVGLQVVDKFVYPVGGDQTSYMISEIFREDSPFLTKKAFEAGILWHVFQGWFAQGATRSGRILNQLNLSSTETFEQGSRLVTIIDHRITFQPRSASFHVKALMEEKGDGTSELDGLFDELHASNIELIRDLLNNEKLASIGCDGGTTR